MRSAGLRIGGLRARAKRFARCRRGVAAIEFAIVAPMLCLALLAMADAGLAARERMRLGHVVRSGAQAAMEGAAEARILEVMRAVAGGEAADAAFAAPRLCACPEAPGVSVDCGATCADDRPTAIFHDISAARSFDGLIAPPFELTAAARLRVR